MTFRDILMVSAPGSEAVGPFAISAAKALGARLHAVGLALDPAIPDYVIPELPIGALERAEEEARVDARARLSAIEAAARSAGVALTPSLIEGDLDTAFEQVTRIARRHDLVVVEQAGPDRPALALLVETLLFGSGRPLLVAPYVQRDPFTLRSALVAWNESAQAARALAAATPLLERAERVAFVTIDAGDAARDGAEALAALFAARGAKARARTLTSAGGVADTLLSHAADEGADLVVMGGYGHSRLREFILGGATREMLAQMTVPVLMAH